LDAIKAFGATALVTLMEPDELTNVRVPESALGSKASAHRIEWHLLPIRDVSVPDEQFEDQWTYSGAKLRDHLRHENNVVIHCRGGLGRTGIIAARLLVEFGESAESAIARVRHARPGSIETPRQEEYVRSCERLAMMSSATGEAFLRVRHRLRLLLGRDYTHLWSSRRVLRISQRSEPEIPR